MSEMPSSAALPDVTDLNAEQVRELAEAYVDLLRLMTEALEACTTGYGFFWWSGRGFNITGHPPDEVVQIIRAIPEEAL